MKANVKYEFHHFGIPVQDGETSGKFSVTNGAKVIHIRRLKSDPGVNLLS